MLIGNCKTVDDATLASMAFIGSTGHKCVALQNLV